MLYLVVQDIAYLLVHFADTLFVHFHQFPIVRDQSVHLYLHIGGLRVDAAENPCLISCFSCSAYFTYSSVTSFALLNCT